MKELYTVEYEELRSGQWFTVIETFRAGNITDPAYRSHDRALRLQGNPNIRHIKVVEWNPAGAHGYHA